MFLSKQQNGLFYSFILSPLGLIGLASSNRGIMRICVGLKNESQFVKFLEKTYRQPLTKKPKAFKDLQDQFGIYFIGKLKQFTCAIDLNQGTLFQNSVWRKLKQIPYAKTRSYRWLAKAIGNPTAYRAVGNANGKNPLPIIIPCHRVIRENGQFGGYTGGVQKKKFLLNLEQNSHGAV